MNILIATPLYPPQIGGPATYAKGLSNALKGQGHQVKIATYGWFNILPTGIRHIALTLTIVVKALGSQTIIALDTFSAGYPAMLAAKILRKPLIIRISGDFLWEGYVERTREHITLSGFYDAKRELTRKERMILRGIQEALAYAERIVFQNNWQRDIWVRAYHISPQKVAVIENACKVERIEMSEMPKQKNFIWAGRRITLKNVEMLSKAFALAKEKDPSIALTILPEMTHDALMSEMRDSYALLLPSFSENSPNIILEAISCGKPFVMTMETGLRERVMGLGILADPFDVFAWRDAILALTDDKNYQYYREQIRAFSFIHTYDDIAREFASLIQKI